jgi:hypothetical protein
MRVLKVFMPSTLTSGVGDGKRSKKLRGMLKKALGEILWLDC